jgi:hypothetical protein
MFICSESEKKIRAFIPAATGSIQTGASCRVCHIISWVPCVRCTGGNHIGCKHEDTPSALCEPCWAETRHLPRVVCLRCRHSEPRHEFEGSRCEKCQDWYHTSCDDISDVQLCDKHGINACECGSSQLLLLCEACVLAV